MDTARGGNCWYNNFISFQLKIEILPLIVSEIFCDIWVWMNSVEWCRRYTRITKDIKEFGWNKNIRGLVRKWGTWVRAFLFLLVNLVNNRRFRVLSAMLAVLGIRNLKSNWKFWFGYRFRCGYSKIYQELPTFSPLLENALSHLGIHQHL